MIVAGPEGFRKNQYRKFNIRSADLTPGDDYGMMREVLTRRFKRLIDEAPRACGASAAIGRGRSPTCAARQASQADGSGPDVSRR